VVGHGVAAALGMVAAAVVAAGKHVASAGAWHVEGRGEGPEAPDDALCPAQYSCIDRLASCDPHPSHSPLNPAVVCRNFCSA
jgi:hypothetical protein